MINEVLASIYPTPPSEPRPSSTAHPPDRIVQFEAPVPDPQSPPPKPHSLCLGRPRPHLRSSPIQLEVQKFRVYRALCDDLEGSDRVPEAIVCFRKMQDELLEMSVPDDQAE